MNSKEVVEKIHLWLGIPSGILVFIIAITGCLYTFQNEIQNMTQPFRYVESQEKAFLPPSRLETIARKELPGKQLHSVKYNEKHKAAEAIFYHYEPTYYYTVYLNPYDGRVLKVNDNETGFFRFILNGHFYLWLPPTIGQPVVASTTLVFVLMLISGIILWFPKSLHSLKQSVRLGWKKSTSWKRKNFDLHNVFGFYASLIALVMALTGLVWGFQWFANGVYKGAGGDKSLVYKDPGSIVVKSDSVTKVFSSIDRVWHFMQKEYPTAKSIEIHPPENDSSSIAANANAEAGTYWKTDYRYFDQYTMAEIPVNHIYGRFHDSKFADKMMRMNYDIHVGAIGGFAGKILVFFIGLIVASLPITGFIIWFLAKKKSKTS